MPGPYIKPSSSTSSRSHTGLGQLDRSSTGNPRTTTNSSDNSKPKNTDSSSSVKNQLQNNLKHQVPYNQLQQKPPLPGTTIHFHNRLIEDVGKTSPFTLAKLPNSENSVLCYRSLACLLYPDDVKDHILVAVIKVFLLLGNPVLTPKELFNVISYYNLMDHMPPNHKLTLSAPHSTISSRIAQHFKRVQEASSAATAEGDMVAALSFRPLFGKLLNYSSAIPIPNHPGGLVIESAEENGEKKMRYYILRLESESQYPRLQSKSIITTRVSESASNKNNTKANLSSSKSSSATSSSSNIPASSKRKSQQQQKGKVAAVRAPITVVDTDDEELLQEPFSSDIEQKVEEEDATDAEEDEEDSMSESDSDGTTHLKLKRKRKGRHSGGSSSSENSTNNRKPNSRVRLRRRGGNDSSDEEKEVEEEEEEEQESSEPEPTRGRSNRRSSKRRTKTTALVTKKETSDSEKDDQEDEDEDDGQHSRSSSSIASSHPRRRTSSSSSALASTSKSSTSRSRSSSSKAATKKSSSRGISKRRGVSNSTSSSNEGDNNSEGGVEVLDGDDDVAAADGASEEENGEDDNNEEDEDEEEEDDDDSDEYEEYVSPKRSARLKKLQIASNQANQDSRSSSASSMSSSKLHTSASSASSVVASLFPFLNLPLLSISPADLSGADLLFGGGVGGMGSGIMNQPAGPANNNFFAFPNNNNNISCSSSSSSSSISTRKRGDLFYSESINLRDDSEDFFDFEMMIDEKVKSPPLRSPPPQLPSKYQEITSSSSFVIKSPVDAVACDQGHESTEMPVKLDKSLLELLPPRIPNAPPGIFMTSVDGAMLMVTWVTGYYQKRQKSPPSTTPSTVIATSASSVDDTLQPSSSSSSSSIPSTSSSTQIPLLRRLDNGLVNASLLLHAGGLRTESERSIVLSLEPHRVRYRESKILNGAWIPLSRAQEMARSFCMQDKVGVFLSDGLGKTLFGVEEVVVKPRLSAKTRKGGKTLMSKFEHLQEASPTTKDLMMAAPIMPLLPPLIGLPTSSLQQQQNISDKKDDSNCASSSSSSSNQQPAQPPTSTSSFTATATNATSNATSATPSTAALQQQIATNFFSQNPLAAQAFLSMIAGANLPLPNTAASALNVDPKARNKSTNIKLNSAAQLRRQQQAAKNLANSINNSMLVNPTFQSPLFNPLQSLLSNNVASSSSSSNNTSSSSSGASHFPFLLSHYTKAAGGISSLAGDSLSNYHSASASAPEKRFKRNPEVMKGMIKDGFLNVPTLGPLRKRSNSNTLLAYMPPDSKAAVLATLAEAGYPHSFEEDEDEKEKQKEQQQKLEEIEAKMDITVIDEQLVLDFFSEEEDEDDHYDMDDDDDEVDDVDDDEQEGMADVGEISGSDGESVVEDEGGDFSDDDSEQEANLRRGLAAIIDGQLTSSDSDTISDVDAPLRASMIMLNGRPVPTSSLLDDLEEFDFDLDDDDDDDNATNKKGSNKAEDDGGAEYSSRKKKVRIRNHRKPLSSSARIITNSATPSAARAAATSGVTVTPGPNTVAVLSASTQKPKSSSSNRRKSTPATSSTVKEDEHMFKQPLPITKGSTTSTPSSSISASTAFKKTGSTTSSASGSTSAAPSSTTAAIIISIPNPNKRKLASISSTPTPVATTSSSISTPFSTPSAATTTTSTIKSRKRSRVSGSSASSSKHGGSNKTTTTVAPPHSTGSKNISLFKSTQEDSGTPITMFSYGGKGSGGKGGGGKGGGGKAHSVSSVSNSDDVDEDFEIDLLDDDGHNDLR